MQENPTELFDDCSSPASFRRQIETVKGNMRIERVAENYGQFRLSGNGRLVGRCVAPDHEDRTPSLNLYTEDQHFKCYGCGEYGDVLDLVQLAEGCELWEAMMILSTRYGMELPGRPEPWYRRQRRQAPIRNGIEAAKVHVARRRLYKKFFEPLVLASTNKEDRVHDAQLFWELTAPLAEDLVGAMMGRQER